VLEIVHDGENNSGHALWARTDEEKDKPAKVQRTHPLYRELRKLYGKSEILPTRGNGNDDTDN
jgi:hypothetical protein